MGATLRRWGRVVSETTRVWARVPFGDAALVGDPKRHLDREELLVALGEAEDLFATPAGCLEAIVLRRAEGGRSQPATAELSTTGGLLGDRWSAGKVHRGDQVSMMNVHVAARIANQQSIALFGDNLFTDLDIREQALPEGSRVQIGGAVLRVSSTPHVPCDRFRARFGHAAFVMAAENHRIRGVYMTVLDGGVIAIGDSVHCG